MALNKVATVFFALLLLLAPPMAYASTGDANCIESAQETTTSNSEFFPAPYNDPISGTYIWADMSKSDSITERGKYLRLNQSVLIPYLMQCYHITWWSPGISFATYGTYEKNRNSSLSQARFTDESKGLWYPESASTIRLVLFSYSIWQPYPKVIFNDEVPVNRSGNYCNAVISLFGHEMVQADPQWWPLQPIWILGAENNVA